MWRINNVLLLVFLVFALGAGGYVFYTDYLYFLDWERDQSVRTLNAEEVVDDEGKRLRTHAVSFSSSLDFDEWGQWSLIPISQSALASPVKTTMDDEIVVTASRNFSGSADSDDVSIPVFMRFTNNLVLRNELNSSERPLFSHKVAITSMLPLTSEQTPGVVAAYIDADDNGDGKIDETDRIKLRLFRFADGAVADLSFEGRFVALMPYDASAGRFSFRTYLDINGNGEQEYSFEPYRLYEVAIADEAAQPALNDATVATLQAIIDGTAASE